MKNEQIFANILSFVFSLMLPLSLFNSELNFTNSYFITLVLFFLLILICAWKIFVKPTIKITIIDVLFIFIFIISILSGFVNDCFSKTTINLKFILYIAIFILVKDVITYKITIVYFYISLIITNLFILVYSLWMLIMDDNYIQFIEEKFCNIGVFSIYLAVSSVFLLALIKKYIMSNMNNAVLLFIIVLNSCLVFMFKSRISAIIIISMCYVVISKLKFVKINSRIVVAIITIAIITLFVYFAFYTKQDSTEGRFLILKISVKMIIENIVIGIGGFNSFAKIYPLYQAEYFSEKIRSEKEIMIADNTQFALNEFIQMICELGFIGLFIVFVIICIMIKNIRSNTVILSVFVAIVIASLFSYILHVTIFQSIFFVIVVIVSFREKPIVKCNMKLFFYIYCLILIVSVVMIENVVSKYTYSLILKYKIEQGFNMGKESYCVIDKFSDNQTFIYPYAIQLFNEGNYDECLKVLDTLSLLLHHSDAECLRAKCYKYRGQIEHSEFFFIRASNICPNRFEYRYELYKLYLEANKLEKAIDVALSIHNLKEKISSPYTLAVKLEIERFLKTYNTSLGYN